MEELYRKLGAPANAKRRRISPYDTEVEIFVSPQGIPSRLEIVKIPLPVLSLSDGRKVRAAYATQTNTVYLRELTELELQREAAKL